jgi:peptidoglycan/LPS O-acetylase OafA/YrhL
MVPQADLSLGSIPPATPVSAGPPGGRRLASLDVLRAVAVILVIGRHMKPPVPGMYGAGLDTFMSAWQRGGWVGVDLFFVLSGFLVSGLLFSEYQQKHTVNVRRFLIRRGLKIYPAFYVLLVVGGITEATFGYRWLKMGVSNFFSEAVFVQNYGPDVFGHTWSLAVEEHFYLLCAGLIFYLARRRIVPDPFRAIWRIVLVVMIFSVVARVIHALLVPYAHRTHLYPTHLRLDGLMLGVGLSYLYYFRRDVLETAIGARTGLVIALGVALLLPAFLFELDRTFLIYTVGLTAFCLGSGLLVVAMALSELPPSPVVRGLAFFGAYSYSIYLWHTLVQQSLDQAQTSLNLLDWPLTGFVVYFASSLLVGTLMAKLVEMPVLRVRDRLLPR